MTSRELRTRRRAEERRQKKIERQSNTPPADSNPAIELAVSPEILAEFGPELIAQANAMRDRVHRAVGLPVVQPPNRSTGPRTPSGKAISARNSFKHGLASGQLVAPGEEPAAFESLFTDLLADHQPANTTEELLVREMAESWWLMQRASRLQNNCFLAEELDTKQLALFLRYRTTYERAFYKALNTLLKLKKEAAKQQKQSVSQNTPPKSGVSEVRSANFPEKGEVGQACHARLLQHEAIAFCGLPDLIQEPPNPPLPTR